MKGVRRLGVRVGNWLTAEEGKKLLGVETADTLRSRRNRALLHVSIQMTERCLGCKQRFRDAVNDHIGVEPDALS